MLETDIYIYYAFGYNYNILRNGAAALSVRGEENSLESILENFFTRLVDLKLQVTEQAASDLAQIYERVKAMQEAVTVDSKLAAEIRNACNKIDTTLDAELQLRTAFIVSPKRFDLHHLLEKPGSLLSEEARSRLPEMAKFDFSSARRAIAFGLATASAFHLMRCVEAMLREYYCVVVKRERIKTLLWYPMIDHMRKRRNAPPRAVLDHLDNIRANFRNPTQHPDARYDLDEAQDLLAVSIDTLNRIARDLAKREHGR